MKVFKKYIRTKDELGIERDDGVCCFRTWAANSNSPLKEDWLYADTIEELCDEFVVVETGIGQHINYTKMEWLSHEGVVGSPTCKVYGAIWTDKGLIYVAKMNHKGELELL